jgi:hypothetical protein
MKKNRNKNYKRRRIIKIVIPALLIVPLIFGWTTPAPKGTSYGSPSASVSDVRMLYDLTYMKNNELIHDQKILDEQIKMIGAAKDFIVADIFLYNDYYNTSKYQFPHSTQRLTDAMIAQKQNIPA